MSRGLVRTLLGGVAVAALLMPAGTAQAQSVWTGTTDTNWGTGTNWNPAGTPTAADAAWATDATANAPTVVDGQFANSVVVNNNTLTVAANGVLIVGTTVQVQSAGQVVVNGGGAILGTGVNLGGIITNTGTWTGVVSNVLGTYTGIANSSVTGGLVNQFAASNAGTISNGVSNSGTFGNTGSVVGGLTNTGGTTTNSGIITGLVTTSGGIVTSTGFVGGNLLSTGGSTTNQVGGTWVGDAINNGGILNNNATWTGAISNVLGTFTNGANSSVSGGLINQSAASNAGTISNGVSNTGTFLNTFAVLGGLTNTAGTTTSTGFISGPVTTAGGIVTSSGTVVGDLLSTGGTTTNAFGGMWTGNAINNGGTLNNDGTWTGMISNVFGTFTNGGTGTVSGGLINQYAASNAGIINNGVSNSGTFVNTNTVNGGVTNTAGSTTNAGTINGPVTTAAGIVTSSGIVVGDLLSTGGTTTNAFGGMWTGNAINNGGTLNNDGIWTGLISNVFGTFTNGGTGTVSGGLINQSTASNTANAVINGGLANLAGATMTNAGTINGGALNNATLNTTGTITGGLTNTATVNAAGTILGNISNTAGTFTVTGPLVGGPILPGTGNFANSALLNVAGGNFTGINVLDNSGMVTIDANRLLEASVINNSAGVISIGANATLHGTSNSINNAATINVATNGSIIDATDINNLAGGTINFNGPGGTATLSAPTITNNNIINVLSGAVAATGAMNNTATGLLNMSAGTSITGASVLNNAGTINMLNGSTVGATLLNNVGTINSTGITTLGANPTNNVTNSGIISMWNTPVGAPTDRINVTGNYGGVGPGGTLRVDVNTATNESDLLAVAGTATGVTQVQFNVLGNGFVTALPVVTSVGTAAGAFLGAIPDAGIISYAFVRDASNQNNWVINSSINAGAASILGFGGALSTITSGFHQPASNFVNCSKPGVGSNQLCFGVWARGDAGRFSANATSASTAAGVVLPSVESYQKLSFQGLQSGADIGILRVNGSKWNAHFGVTGGKVEGTVKEIGGQTDADMPFGSVYAFFTNGALTIDLTARKEYYNLELSNAAAGLSNLPVKGDANAVALVTSYRFNHGNWNVTPQAGLSYTKSNVDSFAITGGTVSPGSDEALIGRLGLQVSYVQQLAPNVFLQPFVGVSGVRNFLNETDLDLALGNPGNIVVINTKTTGVGDYIQYNAGIALAETSLGVTTFIQGALREGDRISGGSVTLGGRVNF